MISKLDFKPPLFRGTKEHQHQLLIITDSIQNRFLEKCTPKSPWGIIYQLHLILFPDLAGGRD